MIETNSPTTEPARGSEDRDELIARIAEGVRAISGQQRCAVARHLHKSGISMTHLQVLWLLGEHGPLPVGRLAESLGVALPNATGLVDRMEQRGLVTRERVPGDRRVVLVRMTVAGREVTDQVDGWRATMFDRLLREFDASDLARLARALDDVRTTFEPHDPNANPIETKEFPSR